MVERLKGGTAGPFFPFHCRPLLWGNGVYVFVHADRLSDSAGERCNTRSKPPCTAPPYTRADQRIRFPRSGRLCRIFFYQIAHPRYGVDGVSARQHHPLYGISPLDGGTAQCHMLCLCPRNADKCPLALSKRGAPLHVDLRPGGHDDDPLRRIEHLVRSTRLRVGLCAGGEHPMVFVFFGRSHQNSPGIFGPFRYLSYLLATCRARFFGAGRDRYF